MRKMVICLTALFLCIFGTAAMEKGETEDKKVLLFTDGYEKAEEVKEAIQDKIEVAYVDEKKLEERELELLIQDAELILVGTEERNSSFYENIESLFQMADRYQKRVSLYMIGENEVVLEGIEKRIQEQFVNMNLLPCFLLSWEEANREDELSRMDGWLTTAFTY